MQTVQGHDVAADPKSIPSADELATQLELSLAAGPDPLRRSARRRVTHRCACNAACK